MKFSSMNDISSLVRHLYGYLIKAASSLQSLFLLVVRLVWGIQFFQAGYGKIFDKGIASVAEFFGGIGIPFPTVNAWAASLTEMIGGALLAIGLASRLTCIPLIVTMIVAYITTELDAVRGLFSNPEPFFSAAPFLFLFATLIILIFGPGKISLDYALHRKFRPVDSPWPSNLS